MKIYLASSWRNEHQERVLVELRKAGHDVYDFKHPAPGAQGFGWRQTIDRPIKTGADLLEALAHPRAQEGFGFDFSAMRWAEACVLLLPCGNSAHLEAGWFAGAGKPVAILCPELREPELMYKCFDTSSRTPLFEHIEHLLQHLHEVEAALIANVTTSASIARANLEEIQRLDLALAKAREQIAAMRVCIVYARDRRQHNFDFDTWIRLVEHALDQGKLPPHAIEDAQAEAMTFWDALQAVRKQRDLLQRELAEQYPVAMAARSAAEEGRDAEVGIIEIRRVVRDIGNSTDAAKLEYLPARFRS